MSPLKILVCGSINGNFSKFFKKISSIQKKNGPFEMVLCCGNFFSDKAECEEDWNRIKKKGTKVDIPVYILGPTSKQQEKFFRIEDKKDDGEEIYENVLYLGSKGIFRTTSGLSIAYACGKEKTNPKDLLGFTKSDLDNLSEQVRRDGEKYVGIDILLTFVWPKDVQKFTNTKTKSDNESALISRLASELKPRYHFTAHEEVFYEPPPYRNHVVLQQEQQHVSRFVAMAPFVNENNQKGLYAFTITPTTNISREELIKQPDVVTECPYNTILSSGDGTENAEQNEQFFFRKDDKKRKFDQNNDRPKKTPKGPPPLSSDCWFCLGSKNVEKHLVISVGEQSYVALAKGALNEDHVLICPIAHHNSTAVLPDAVRMELEKYKQCLQKMFIKEGMTMVTFERNFYTQHLQLQAVGIAGVKPDEIVDTFEDLAKEKNMEITAVPEEKDLTEMVSVTTPYFYVEVDDEYKLLHRVKGKMPLQFGREVLASPTLLNLPDRTDWKNCKVSKEEETQMTKTFRNRFKPFDFNFL